MWLAGASYVVVLGSLLTTYVHGKWVQGVNLVYMDTYALLVHYLHMWFCYMASVYVFGSVEVASG